MSLARMAAIEFINEHISGKGFSARDVFNWITQVEDEVAINIIWLYGMMIDGDIGYGSWRATLEYLGED